MQCNKHTVKFFAREIETANEWPDRRRAHPRPFLQSGEDTVAGEQRISRSALGAAIRTATLPSDFINELNRNSNRGAAFEAKPPERRSSSVSCTHSLRISHNAYFAYQVHACLLLDRVLHVIDQRPMSAAVALPVLTMKFACFVETCAPPMLNPFNPQIRSIAPRDHPADCGRSIQRWFIERLAGQFVWRAVL